MSAIFPAGTVARLHHVQVPGLPSAAWLVILAGTADDAVPEILAKPGCLNFLATVDSSLTWPDATGIAGSLAALERGGVAALAFPKVKTAIACMRRIATEAGR